MTKFLNLFFVTVVLIILTVPGLFTVFKVATGSEQADSRAERRRLATFTGTLDDINSGKLSASEIGPSFGEAFKDQLSAREKITSVVNRKLVNVFKHSTSDQMVIGTNEYYFTTGIRDFAKLHCGSPSGFDAEASAKMLATFDELKERLNKKGVEVYALIVPGKQSLFPEKLPEPFRSLCTNQDHPLNEMLQNSPNYPEFISWDLDWFKAQGPEEIYDRRSFHWHRPGATRFIRHTITDGVLSNILEPSELVEGRTWESEIDNGFDLGIGSIPYAVPDYQYLNQPKKAGNALTLPEVDQKNLSKIIKRKSIRHISFSEGGNGNGTGVLIGDSFTKNAWTYFYRHFEKGYRFYTGRMTLRPGLVDDIVDYTDADYVVILFTENKWTLTKGQITPTSFHKMMKPTP